MKIERVGALALVVDTSPQKKNAAGHIILDRYSIDGRGNARLTASGLSMDDLEGVIELIKAELDALSLTVRTVPDRALN